jgi:hypothetical protein
VAPGFECTSSDEMKMCSISVAPMPSMISMPVACFHCARVAAGSASPAETHLARLERSCALTCAAIARYDEGTVKHTVARNCAIAASSWSGGAFSSNTVDAPMRIGISRMPPRPNVKASGGLPMKTSSGFALNVDFGQQSHMAITSRWKCIVPWACRWCPT